MWDEHGKKKLLKQITAVTRQMSLIMQRIYLSKFSGVFTRCGAPASRTAWYGQLAAKVDGFCSSVQTGLYIVVQYAAQYTLFCESKSQPPYAPFY